MKIKLLSAVFAATMMLGASMTVFAADVTPNDLSGNEVISGAQEIEMEGEVKEAHLEVTITAGTTVVANPYKLAVGTVPAGKDSLVGSTIEFENKSDTPLAIGLIGKIKLYPTAANKPAEEEKQITINKSSEEPETPKSKQIHIEAKVSSDLSGNNLLMDEDGKAAVENMVYVEDTGEEITKMSLTPVLCASTATVSANDPKNSDKMVLTLMGWTTQSPEYAWDEKDEFNVITVYDIKFSGGKEASKFGKN